MDEFQDDPLDLLEDDGDGVIETILLLDDDDKKTDQVRTGCGVLLVTAASLAGGAGWWMTRTFLT